MQATRSWLTERRAKKLLRLYLAWPGRFDADDRVVEAQGFYTWLKDGYGSLEVVSAMSGVQDAAEFLDCNPEVIEAGKFLKPAQTTLAGDSVRKEERVRTTTQIILSVYDCAEDPSLIGYTTKGIVIDVTSNGLGVELDRSLPVQSIVNMTVAPAGLPITIFRMTGEVRWLEESGRMFQVGIKLFEIEEADRWREEFSLRFTSAHGI